MLLCGSCESKRSYQYALTGLSKNKPLVLSPHIPDCVILLSKALFFATQDRFFLRPELSRCTTIAVVIGQTKVILTELVLTNYQCHGMGWNTQSD